MVSEQTIEKVTRALMRPLLPVDGLRQTAHNVLSRKIELSQLLEPEEDIAFLHNAYLTLLGRAADQQGVKSWLAHLRSGVLTRAAVIQHLLDSEEGRRKNIVVPGLPILIECHDLPTVSPNNSTRQGISKKDSTSAVKLAAAVDREINDVELQVQRLAAECLSNFEHIEHRLSKLRPDHALASKDAVHVVAIESRKSSDPRVALLHQKMDRSSAGLVTTSWREAVRSLRSAAMSVTGRNESESNWIVCGENVVTLVNACRSEGIEVSIAGTSPSQTGYLVHRGAHVDDRDSLNVLRSVPDRSAAVCWGRLRTSDLDDGTLIQWIDTAARVVAGGILVLEQTDGSGDEFEPVRLRAALNVCGLMKNEAVSMELFEPLMPRSFLTAIRCPSITGGERV